MISLIVLEKKARVAVCSNPDVLPPPMLSTSTVKHIWSSIYMNMHLIIKDHFVLAPVGLSACLPQVISFMPLICQMPAPVPTRSDTKLEEKYSKK